MPTPAEPPPPIELTALARRAVTLRTPSGDGRMVWRAWGAEDAPPVVLLHGGSGSWTHWLRNIEPLARGFRVLAADLPGLGDSDMPPRAFDHADLQGSVRHLAALVEAGLEALGLRPAHVVGFSLGSIVGGWLAAQAPTRVQSYTMVGGAGLGLPWQGLGGTLRAMTADMSHAQRLDCQRHNLGVMMMAAPERIDALACALQLANAEHARVRTHPLAGSDVLRNALPGIEAPMHAIWGELDIYALPDLQARIDLLRSHQRAAGIDVLAGGGHWVMYECAQAFNAALAARLAKV